MALVLVAKEDTVLSTLPTFIIKNKMEKEKLNKEEKILLDYISKKQKEISEMKIQEIAKEVSG